MKIPVCFTYTQDVPLAIAQRLIDSVKREMPRSHIYHQTDETTPAIEGTITVRLPKTEDFAEFFLRHLAECPLEKFIKLDYDCVVLRSIYPLFTDDFQVGLTRRDVGDKAQGDAFTKRHPHNAGVMFSKGKHTFWKELYQAYMAIPDRDGWMDACDAMETAVANTKVKVKDYPCSRYNYTPEMPLEDLKGRDIVHYKGMRKHWALDTGAMMPAIKENWNIDARVKKWLGRRT
jgi:hypothetical protein